MTEASIPKAARRIAETYDAFASVQRLAAADVLALLGGCEPESILEPGCGTGIYTAMLAAAFPGARIEALDVDERALEPARMRLASFSSVRCVCADAEDAIAGRYGVITSNAAFHWFRDLPAALERYHEMLVENGVLAFSHFGPGTFGELQQALRETIGPQISIAAGRFAGYGQIENVLRRLFSTTRMEEKRYVQVFDSLQGLLESIRGTGTRGTPGGPPVFWTKRLMARVEDAYMRRCGRIQATYQVFLCRGVK